jgi:CRISPR system Cascade subunit CasB
MSQIEHNDRFVEFLIRNRDDRPLMASLRRGLAQPNSAEVSRVVQPWLSEDSVRWLEDAYYTIAPLFALHHEDIAEHGNMGSHFRALAESMKPSYSDELPRSVERRFMQLLACGPNDLNDLLRQAVSLLRSKEIAVNWQQLLKDILAWKHSDDRRDHIRREWSRRFWRSDRRINPSENQITNS